MNITQKTNNKAHCLALNGDLTIYEAQTALHTINEMELSHDKPIHLDLSSVTELDTAGLQLLFYLKKSHKHANPVKITKSNAQIDEVLELLKLHTAFETDKASSNG